MNFSCVPIETPFVPLPATLRLSPPTAFPPNTSLATISEAMAYESTPEVWMICTKCGKWERMACVRESRFNHLRPSLDTCDPAAEDHDVEDGLVAMSHENSANSKRMVALEKAIENDRWLIPLPSRFVCGACLTAASFYSAPTSSHLLPSLPPKSHWSAVVCSCCNKIRHVPYEFPGVLQPLQRWSCDLYPFFSPADMHRMNGTDDTCCVIKQEAVGGVAEAKAIRSDFVKTTREEGEVLPATKIPALMNAERQETLPMPAPLPTEPLPVPAECRPSPKAVKRGIKKDTWSPLHDPPKVLSKRQQALMEAQHIAEAEMQAQLATIAEAAVNIVPVAVRDHPPPVEELPADVSDDLATKRKKREGVATKPKAEKKSAVNNGERQKSGTHLKVEGTRRPKTRGRPAKNGHSAPEQVLHWAQCDLCNKWRVIRAPWRDEDEFHCDKAGIHKLRGTRISCRDPEDSEHTARVPWPLPEEREDPEW